MAHTTHPPTATTAAATGQVVVSAAEVYERFFVPALFAQWPPVVLDAARVSPGDTVLDVGCGSGVLARAAARAVGPRGAVTGLDLNEGMLAVARRTPEPVDWRQGRAEDLPFADGSFDRVVSQFALMFLSDRSAAVREMARVARPGGTVTVATWARVEESPGYDAMVRLLDRVLGRDAADALRAPFVLGTADSLAAELTAALPDPTVTRHAGTARFGSLEEWVHTDIRGWTLAGSIDDDQYAELLAAARTELAGFVQPDGSVAFAAPALVGTAAV